MASSSDPAGDTRSMAPDMIGGILHDVGWNDAFGRAVTEQSQTVSVHGADAMASGAGHPGDDAGDAGGADGQGSRQRRRRSRGQSSGGELSDSAASSGPAHHQAYAHHGGGSGGGGAPQHAPMDYAAASNPFRASACAVRVSAQARLHVC